MIEELNRTVWATIGVSKIHGIGVFAIRFIPKGQRVHAIRESEEAKWYSAIDFTGLHPAILEIIKQRWPYATGGAAFQSPNMDVRLLSFMNHSQDNNYDYNTDRTLRDIKAGEEICERYPLSFVGAEWKSC